MDEQNFELWQAAHTMVERLRPTIASRIFSTRQAFYRLEDALYGCSSEPFLHADGTVRPKDEWLHAKAALGIREDEHGTR